MRDQVPSLDAAVGHLVRLCGRLTLVAPAGQQEETELWAERVQCNQAQRSLQIQALTLALDLARLRLLLFEQLGSSILVPFLAVLVFWLCIIFASFGLFAPRNGTVIAVLCVCALSVSGAIFLILELDRSFEGLLQVSGAAARGPG